MANMFDENGNYIKTEWKPGDRITAGKLNKIEESLEAINNNDIERHKEADERLDALEEQNEAVNDRFDELEDLVADNKTEVEVLIYDNNVKMDRLEQEMNDGIDTVEAIAHTVDDKIAEADASMKAQVAEAEDIVDQGKADMEAMIAEADIERLSTQLAHIENNINSLGYFSPEWLNSFDIDNSHIAINEAIQYVSSIGGGVVKLSSKKYKIKDTIKVLNSVKLEGTSVNGSSWDGSNGSVIIKDFDGDAIISYGSINDLKIDGNNKKGNGLLIQSFRCHYENILVTHNTDKNSIGVLLGTLNSDDKLICNCNNIYNLTSLHNSIGMMIHDENDPTQPNTNANCFYGLNIRDSLENGLIIDGSIDNSFYGATIEINQGTGVLLKANAKNQTFYSIYTENNTTKDITVEKSAKANKFIGYRYALDVDINDLSDNTLFLAHESQNNHIPKIKKISIQELYIRNSKFIGDRVFKQTDTGIFNDEITGFDGNTYIYHSKGSASKRIDRFEQLEVNQFKIGSSMIYSSSVKKIDVGTKTIPANSYITIDISSHFTDHYHYSSFINTAINHTWDTIVLTNKIVSFVNNMIYLVIQNPTSNEITTPANFAVEVLYFKHE